jgi:HEAT repeat protein
MRDRVRDRDELSESLYEQARRSIEREQFERALSQLGNIIDRFGTLPTAEATANRVDAALYWKAYAEAKQRQIEAALQTVQELQKTFANSGWVKDAMALAVERRQSTGQAVSPDLQPDEDLKLLALRGLMQSDPDKAIPRIEQMLSGSSSVRVKENALFVLTQSRSPQAHDILVRVAKGAANPDLQVRAIRYLGSQRSAENMQVLEEVYRSSSDERVKRAVLRGYMNSGDRARLAMIAGDANASESLRGEAILQLGNVHADDELVRIYNRESSKELKRRAAQALGNSGNARALVTLARQEKDPELKRIIVSRLSTMKSSEATDYLMELLK